MKSRIVKQGDVAISELMAHPFNFRRHPKEQQKALSAAIGEVGWVQGVIYNQRTGYLIDGHARVEEAMRQGWATIPCTIVDLSEEEEKKVLATFDRLGGMAFEDESKLDELLGEIAFDSEDLEGLFADNDLGGSAAGGDEALVPPKDDNIAIRVSVHPAIWLSKREEILGILDKMQGAYEITFRVEE